MKMRKWTIIIALLLMISTANALDICEDTTTPNQECRMVTPVLNCTEYTYSILNLTGSTVTNGTLNALNDSVYYFNFNQSTGDYVVKLCDDTTREIYVNGGGNNMYLAIMIAVLSMAFLFYKFSSELNTEHMAMKLLFGIVAFLFGIGGLFLSIEVLEFVGVTGGLLNGVNTLYKAALITFYLFSAYLMFYYVYKVFIWINEKLVKGKYR